MILLITKLYFKILSMAAPAKAGREAFYIFQKTRKLPFKKVELDFYDRAKKFEIVHPREFLHGYEMGRPNGRLIILVHGWESNAGSMSGIAHRLANAGYRVVAFDLPAHGKSELTHTNLRECAEALRAVIYHLRPSSMSIISHSFGSAVATLALSGTRYHVDDFIMLTSPNHLINIFDDFRKLIGLGDAAYDELLRLSASILNSPVSWLSISDKLKLVNFNSLTLIHDRYDRVLPFANSEEINNVVGSDLYVLENAGHYRMLQNKDVIDRILEKMDSESSHQRLSKSIREFQLAG